MVKFLDSWKFENRNVLPKPDKDDYHKANSYRTVSVTSIIGKRFEQITSKRLLVAIDSDNLDENQFVYLTGPSATQALNLIVEELKKVNLTGKSAATIFFDMGDAFGSVDRKVR